MSKLFDQKIHQRTLIYVSIDKVFGMITTAEGWDSFFTTGMQLDARKGGVCSFAWQNWGPDKVTLRAPGEVVDIRPLDLFSFKWGVKGSETTIRMELSERDGGTLIDLIEDGYEDTPEGRFQILDCAAGWGEALTLLKFRLEHGITYTSALGE